MGCLLPSPGPQSGRRDRCPAYGSCHRGATPSPRVIRSPAVTDQAAPSPPPPPGVARRRYVPALLDAVIPGLGHLAARRLDRAAVFGLPTILLAGLLVGAAVSAGPVRLGSLALNDTFMIGLIGLQAIVLVWRLAAMGSSLLNPQLPRLRGRDAVPVLLLALLAAGPQAYLGYATNVAREQVGIVFAPATSGGGAWIPGTPTPGPESSTGIEPSPEPSPSPSPAEARMNVLLIGVDAGVGRRTFLTDTLIVASLDPLTETVSLLSLARDMVDVPLPDGRTYPDKINSLLSYARLHPGEFPGSTGDGHDVLMAAVGTLLGLDIQRYAQVNLGGFVALVDSLGGVDVNVAHSFCDPTYHEYGFTNGFAISAGRHHLDGSQALAYARVRKAAGESDFTRQARQQEIISGVRDAVVKGGFLADPIGFFQAVGQTAETNIPRDVILPLAQVAERVDRTRTYRAVVTYPLVRPGFDVRGSIQLPDIAGIRALAATLFPSPGTLPTLTYVAPPPTAPRASGSGVSACLPAATPAPSPRPLPVPSSSPVPSAPAGPSPSDAAPTSSPTETAGLEPSSSPAP
jgi:LCP family protein required for cell wall assembly